MATSAVKPIGVIIPTRWEAGDVLCRFPFTKIDPGLYQVVLHERSVLLCISGVGREAARRASERLVAEGVGELVSMGFCGALIPELHVGDLVTDRIATVDKPVRTPDERRALAAQASAVAADMETQAIVEEGTRRGVPIRARRVVSDEFQDDLTPLFGKSGTFSCGSIAVRLLNPSVWPLAARLRRHSAVARAALADALNALAREE
jgi:purine-nucleoside phosphorylase